MAEFICIYRDGVGYWTRYLTYDAADAYELCTYCRYEPTCASCDIIKEVCDDMQKKLIVWECVTFVER